MNKQRFYQFIIAGLLICNVVIIGFFLLGKKKRNKRKSPQGIITERLNFNKAQEEAYGNLIQEHRGSILVQVEKMKGLKNKLYGTLGTKTDSITIDSIHSQLANCKMAIEKIHYAHFTDIKELCNDKQMAQFNELTKDLAKLFSPKRRFKKPSHEKP